MTGSCRIRRFTDASQVHALSLWNLGYSPKFLGRSDGYTPLHRQMQWKLQTQSYRPQPTISGRAAELLRETIRFASGSAFLLLPHLSAHCRLTKRSMGGEDEASHIAGRPPACLESRDNRAGSSPQLHSDGSGGLMGPGLAAPLSTQSAAGSGVLTTGSLLPPFFNHLNNVSNLAVDSQWGATHS